MFPSPTAAVLCMVSGDIAESLRGARAPNSTLGSTPVGQEVILAKHPHSRAASLGPNSTHSKDEFPSVANLLSHSTNCQVLF